MAAKRHMGAISPVLKHYYDCPNHGLKLKTVAEWDGSQDFEFSVGKRYDSDHAKTTQTR